jgi:nitronate monooxygenase
MGIQISSVAGARRALDVGADYLICQGTEAGGHVQSTRTLYEVLPAVIDEAKTVPVLGGAGSQMARISGVHFWPGRPMC